MTDDDPTLPPSLADIEARLQAVRHDHGEGGEEAPQEAAPSSGMGIGMRIGTELVSAVVVGFGLGWALDHWLGTRPVFLLIGLVLGAAAGFMNVFRVARGLDDAVGLGRAMDEKKRRSRN